MSPLPKPKHSKTKSTEKAEVGVLQLIFAGAEVLPDLTHGDDDFPAIDGYIHLLNKEREMIGQMLQVQIKPVRYKKGGLPTASVKMELLGHAYGSSTPVLVLAVDIAKNLAYWVYLSPESVKDANAKGSQKTATINFPKKNLLKKNGPDYADEWRRICLHHRNESNDKIMLRLINKRKKEPPAKQVSPASLEGLAELIFYRTNNGEYPFFDYTLSLATEIKRQDEATKIRYLDILERVYYYRVPDVLKILFEHALDENEKVVEKARKILLEVAKYNVHILNTLGYEPHRHLVDAMKVFVVNNGRKVRSLSIEILQNVLSSSFEGTSHPDHITITFHRGALEPTPYLQKIRRDAIGLLFDLLGDAPNTQERLQVLEAIFHSLHSPDHGHPDDENQARYLAMVNAEASDAIKRYKKLLFPTPDTLTDEYPIIYEIEHQMAWLSTWKRDVKGLPSFLASLRSAESDYGFYRTVYGEAHELHPEGAYEEERSSKEERIQSYIDGLTLENADSWLKLLNKVAVFANSLQDTKDSWKFNHFRDFLARIGKQKPKIADRMLQSIFAERGPLYLLAGNFLFGLRQSSLTLWDKYAKQVEKDPIEELAKALLVSFEFHPASDVKKKLRSKDIELLTRTARLQGGFAALKGKTGKLFFYQCMRAALYSYQADTEQCRSLIIELLKSHPEDSALFFDQISFSLWDQTKWMVLDDWKKADLKVLADALVDVQRLDHNEEQILLKLGQKDFNLLISVIDRRLAREEKEKENFSWDSPRFSSYDAIPHHLYNQDLATFIRDHKDYRPVLLRWISETAEEGGISHLDLSRMIRFIGGNVLESTIQDLISSGKKENLKKVLALFPFTEAPDFQLCFQIIEATDDKEILDYVSGKMRNMGVMSGAYGDDLYGNGLRRIKERLEKEGMTHSSKRVRDFSAEMIRGLESEITDSAERNKKRLEEDKEEFENL